MKNTPIFQWMFLKSHRVHRWVQKVQIQWLPDPLDVISSPTGIYLESEEIEEEEEEEEGEEEEVEEEEKEEGGGGGGGGGEGGEGENIK
jgi:hypothetical protein